MAHPGAQHDWRTFLEAKPSWKQLAKGVAPLVHEKEHDRTIRVAAATLGVFDSLLVDPIPKTSHIVLQHLWAAFDSASQVPVRNVAVETIGMTSCATLLAATGYPVDPRGVLLESVDGVLDREAAMWDIERTSLALACLACGLDGMVGELVGVEPGLYEPGSDYGPDYDRFTRSTVTAIAMGAGQADFAPTWRSFCESFPERLDSGVATLPQLLFAAYAVYTRIYGLAPGDVFEELHGYVHAIADG